MTVVIARISTLYGVGQATGKKRGLVAEIVRQIRRNQPVRIYVPFYTLRDYIYSNDAACKMLATTLALGGDYGSFIKIIASETPVTTNEMISVCRRVSRRSLRFIR